MFKKLWKNILQCVPGGPNDNVLPLLQVQSQVDSNEYMYMNVYMNCSIYLIAYCCIVIPSKSSHTYQMYCLFSHI